MAICLNIPETYFKALSNVYNGTYIKSMLMMERMDKYYKKNDLKGGGGME